jgi:hypothetical protein
VAEVYANRGDLEQALRWLERAYVQKDGSLKWIVGDPTMVKLGLDPRYRTFLRKMNLGGR